MRRYSLTKAMHEFLKILMKLFYIAFFVELGWLLSRDDMKVHRAHARGTFAKALAQMPAKKIPRDRISKLSTHGKSEARYAKIIIGVIENPVPKNPLAGLFA